MVVKHESRIPGEDVGAGVGARRQVLVSSEEGPHFAMRKFTIAPGGHMPLHTNTVEHQQYVLGGRARIRIGDTVHEVEPGSVLLIPAGAPHDYRVVGEADFEFICVVPNAPADIVQLVEERDAGEAC